MRSEDIGGAILGTGSRIELDKVTLHLSSSDAYALCNILYADDIKKNSNLETSQKEALILIGQDLALFCDHPARIKKFNDSEL